MSYAFSSSTPSAFYLPTSLVPKRYDLTLCAALHDAPTPHFAGLVHLLAEVTEATDKLGINVGTSLDTSNVEVVRLAKAQHGLVEEAGEEHVVLAPLQSPDPSTGQALVQLPAPLPPDTQVRLTIAFHSTLKAQPPEGFYLSNDPVTPHSFAMTQFQPCGARRAFPCIDQPDLKANFSVRIIHTSTIGAVSNMPVKTSKILGTRVTQDEEISQASRRLGTNWFDSLPTFNGPDEKTQWLSEQFELSPLMPTYLVAWAMGKFGVASSQYTSPLSGQIIPIRLLAPDGEHDVAKQGDWAVKLTAKAMVELERLLGVEYPLPKLDLLASSNMSARGMENWGLITAQETVLLVDPERMGPAVLSSARTILHECAHVCGFGNLVTMRDWSECWLNEGFATFAGEAVALSNLMPDSQADELFVSMHRTRALELDALHTTHPVVNKDVFTTSSNLDQAIANAFDGISYSKGACLLRMLAHLIGLKTFLQGASLFLRTHAWGSATSDDLWNALSQVSGVDVTKVIGKWINEPGYPLLTVNAVDATTITVKQHRFRVDALDASPQEPSEWYVPLYFKAVSVDGEEDQSLSAALKWEDHQTIKLPEVPAGCTWLLNSSSYGLYRVKYSPELLDQLLPKIQAKGNGLNSLDKTRLLDDATTLARMGVGKTSSLLSLVMALKDQESLTVLGQLSAVFSQLASLFYREPEEVQHALHQAAAAFYAYKLDQVGFEPQPSDSEETRKVRMACIGGAAMAGETKTVAMIKDLFKQACNGTMTLPGTVLSTIYMAAIRYGGTEEWEAVWSIYTSPPSPIHREAAIAGLTASQKPALIERTVDFVFGRLSATSKTNGCEATIPNWHYSRYSLTDSQILTFCSCMSLQPTSIRRLLFEAVEEHWGALRAHFEGGFLWGGVVTAALSSMVTDEDLQRSTDFVAQHPEAGVAASRAMEVNRNSHRWLRACRNDVVNWLQEHHHL